MMVEISYHDGQKIRPSWKHLFYSVTPECIFVAMTLKEKKEYAYVLFTKQGLTQKEIAAKVKVSEKTIGTWKSEGKWERVRASLMITREAQLTMLYEQLNELNIAISQREKGKRYAESKESDAISKYAKAINYLQVETGVSEIVSVGKELLDLVRQTDIKAAQNIADWFEALIKTKLKK